MVPAPSKATQLFIAYSREDSDLREELEAHLALLRREGWISIWHSALVKPGEPLELTIRRQLDVANMIILLVTKDFIASDFCYGVELCVAETRHRSGHAKLIPILARPCDAAILSYLPVPLLPRTGTPVASHESRDAAWTSIIGELRSILNGTSSAPDANGKTFSISLPRALDWRLLFFMTAAALIALIFGVILASPAMEYRTNYVYFFSSSLPVKVALSLSPFLLLTLPCFPAWRSFRALVRTVGERPAVSLSSTLPQPAEPPQTTLPRAPYRAKLDLSARQPSTASCEFCGWVAAPESEFFLSRLAASAGIDAGRSSLARCTWCARFHNLLNRTRASFQVVGFAATALSTLVLAYQLFVLNGYLSTVIALAVAVVYTITLGRLIEVILAAMYTPKGDKRLFAIKRELMRHSKPDGKADSGAVASSDQVA